MFAAIIKKQFMEEHPRLTALIWFGTLAAIPIVVIGVLCWRTLPISYLAGALASVLLWAPVVAGDIANPTARCGYKMAALQGVFGTLLSIFTMGLIGGLFVGAMDLRGLLGGSWSLGLMALAYFGVVLVPYGALVGWLLRRRRQELFENAVG